MADCIFCGIASGQMPSVKIYENDEVLSFLDIMPANTGHALVIPKTHYETILDIPEGILEKLSRVVKKIALAIYKNLKPDGINILQSNYKTAGQIIGHIHFHVIPRWENDALSFSWKHKQLKTEELKKIAEKIRNEC